MMYREAEIEVPIKKRDYETDWAVDHLSRILMKLPEPPPADVLATVFSRMHASGNPICLESEEAWLDETRVAAVTGKRPVRQKHMWALKELREDEFVSTGYGFHIFSAAEPNEAAAIISKVPAKEWHVTLAVSKEFVPFSVRYDNMNSSLRMEQFILENMADDTVIFYSPDHCHLEIMAKDLRPVLQIMSQDHL